MSWALILPYVKKLGPYLLILLALFGFYRWAYSRGADKWQGRYDYALEQRDAEHAAAVKAVSELEKVEAALAEQNAAIEEMERQHAEQLKNVTEGHETAIREQAEGYQRAIAEARERAQRLSERVRLLSVAETCHEAWVEVGRE